MDWGGRGGGACQRHCSTISMINISVHKSAAITEKGQEVQTPRPRWVSNTVHCCQAVMCSHAYSSSQLRQGVPLVPVIVKALQGTSAGT